MNMGSSTRSAYFATRHSDIQEFNELLPAVVRYGNNNVRYGMVESRDETHHRLTCRRSSRPSDGLAAVRLQDGCFGLELDTACVAR